VDCHSLIKAYSVVLGCTPAVFRNKRGGLGLSVNLHLAALLRYRAGNVQCRKDYKQRQVEEQQPMPIDAL
jgi:hypothetical protein